MQHCIRPDLYYSGPSQVCSLRIRRIHCLPVTRSSTQPHRTPLPQNKAPLTPGRHGPKQLKSAPGLSPIVHCEPFACVVLESSFFVNLCNSVLLAVCSTRKLSWDMYVCVLNRCFKACIAGRRTSDMYMHCKQKGRLDIKES